jgi:predicted ATPase/DNA-binding CsgD family transcriptional regulator
MIKSRHRTGRARPHAASPALGALPSTVLSDPARLFGREREMEAVLAHLLGDSARLVTLTGPGGIGKTRLALAAARGVQPAFRDGVWYVDLAPLHDPAEINAAIGQALGLEEAAVLPPAERVAAYLRDRHLLLVLDNFEHLSPAAARVAELLAAAPALKVLVTSREPLKLRLEHQIPVAGLALPDLRAPDLATVEQAPAAALFLEHARRIQPDLALAPADAHALAALLHRLDGIPLAIRIAAARSRVLSPAAMLARLQGQALLSTEEARDVPGRHHTLRDTMDWSFGLLSATEQAAFRQLGVFLGGWTLEAAEAVVQDAEPATPAWIILGLLVDKSLVQADALAGADRRYRMLQPIREYASGRLRESGEVDTARGRHARYYLALAERAAAAGWGPGEEAWFRRLEADHENIRAALRWSTERGDGEFSLRLTGALADFWAVRGYLREGRRWLENARALGPDNTPFLRAKALVGEGTLAIALGDYLAARVVLQEALTLAEHLCDPALTGRVLSRLGTVTALLGDATGAQAVLERSVVLSREAGAPDTAIALVNLGRVFVLLEDLKRAEATATEGLDLARTAGSPYMMAFALTSLAQLKLRHRNYPPAARLASEALRLARALESRRGITYVIMIAALIGGHHGDVKRAARLLAAVDSWSDWTGEVVSLTYYNPASYAALHARARRQMGEAAYGTVVAEAHAMSVDQVIDLAQACLEPSAPHGADPTAATGGAPRPAFLSNRERSVLRLVAEGLLNKRIATSLNIGERTVKAHLTSAMRKLGVDTRAHAAVAAVQRDLL